MNIQSRIFRFVTRTNWVIFALASLIGTISLPPDYAAGIFFGGLLVTLNFHLLSRTLKRALTPPHIASPSVVLTKYYIRFSVSAVIIFFLIKGHYVHPVGLVAGLSVVVASIFIATACEITHLIFKEVI